MSDTLVKMKTGTITKLEQKNSNGTPVVPIQEGTIYFAVDATGNDGKGYGKIVYDNSSNQRIVMSTLAEKADYAVNADYAASDDAGNPITSTYVKKSGDSLSGRLTMTSGKPINQILTGTGTAATRSGSNYLPAKWTFNSGLTVADGDIFTIKIPVAGHDYGVFMSINNGTNYYPVVLNGTNRVTTNYPVNTYIQVVFEATGSAASMFPLAGGTSRVTVSNGIFRVINYYDSGNSGVYQNYSPKAFKIGATATTAYDLLAEDATGLIVPAHKVAHRVGSPIYIASSAKAANTTGNWWDMYQRHYSMKIGKDGNDLTTTAYNPIYLKGTISNGLFTPDTTTPYVFTKAACNVSGAYYMFVGDAQTSNSYINFNDYHPYYYYNGSQLLLYSEIAGLVAWANISGKPSQATSWPNWGQILQSGAENISEGTSDLSDNTEILTSYASNNGFADTNNKGVVYRRDAVHVYNYIKAKTDTLYAAKSHTHSYLPLSGGTLTGALTLSGAPTENLHAATKQYVDQSFSANDAMIFKGTIGTGGTVTALPAIHNAGWTYRVITAGTYAGVVCEIGDLIICITDGTTANNAHWTVTQTNIDGAVIGPSSATDGNFALFSGTSGKLIQNSSYSPNSFATAGHTHTTSLATGGTSTINLAENTAYTLTAGGTSIVFKTPPDNNTKNTAGSTDTSSKIFLIGATSQAANPQTYSDNQIYATNGQLDANKMRVAEHVSMQYNTTTQSLDFIFA